MIVLITIICKAPISRIVAYQTHKTMTNGSKNFNVIIEVDEFIANEMILVK
jgi:hypothetical protein